MRKPPEPIHVPLRDQKKGRVNPMDNKVKARILAEMVRNTELENLHTGITPSSKTGDFSDVKVVTPYGEIPWEKLSRISDTEMRTLMLDVEQSIEVGLNALENAPAEVIEQKVKILEEIGPSWDRKDFEG